MDYGRQNETVNQTEILRACPCRNFGGMSGGTGLSVAHLSRWVGVCGGCSFVSFVFIMAGYRLCRGWKNKVFAYGVSGLVTVLTEVAIPAVIVAAQLGTEQFCSIHFLHYLIKNTEIDLEIVLLFLFMMCGYGQILQGYLIAPHQRARYEAGKYAGGMMYNMCPQQIPMREIPKRFYVGGKLEVEREQLRTIPSLAKSKTFSVDEIAGVVLGGCTGSNVLYDSEYQVLAKFAWSMANSEVLFWYLQRHQVPFDNLPAHLQCNHIEPKQ